MRDRIVAPAPDVIVREVGEELVLLDMNRGAYYGLDPIGARVWKLLASGTSLANVVDQLAGDYEVTREQLESDAEALVSDLESRGLVIPAR